MSRKIFSLDIQDNGIAAVLVENSLKGNWIQSRHFVPYADSAEDAPGAADATLEALKKIVEEISLTGVEAIVSISPRLVSYRDLPVPFKDPKKIRQVLPFELEPTLPYPVEDLTVDFQTISQGEKTHVLVGFLLTAELMKIVDSLKAAGIEPRMVAPAGLASVMCLAKYLETGEDLLFVNADQSYSTVFAVASGRVHIARSFHAPMPDTRLKAKKLSDAVIQVVGAFEATFVTAFEPARIWISGTGMDAAVLQEEIHRVLDIPVTHVNLLHDIDLNIKPAPGVPFEPDRMNAALSLAALEIFGLPAINFFGSRSIIKKYWEEYRNDFIRTGVMAAFVFVIALFNVLLEAHFLQKEVQRYNRQIAFLFQSTFPDVTKIIDPLQQMRAKVDEERKKNMFTGDMENEMANIDILNEISSRIPAGQDVEFTNFVRGDKSLLVTGNTDSFNTVDDIKGRLSQAEGLKNITINSANMEKATNRIQFKLKIDL
ncbi:MAG: type II secretion system protein GspL [Desulfobacteraceae bacterium]|nr:type II secretion system protein GspL [Desulfobacteraceae bacterium]